MHGVHIYLNYPLGPGGCDLIWAPFSWLSFVFNLKGVCTFWNLLSSGWGCNTFFWPLHTQRALCIYLGNLYIYEVISLFKFKQQRQQ